MRPRYGAPCHATSCPRGSIRHVPASAVRASRADGRRRAWGRLPSAVAKHHAKVGAKTPFARSSPRRYRIALRGHNPRLAATCGFQRSLRAVARSLTDRDFFTFGSGRGDLGLKVQA